MAKKAERKALEAALPISDPRNGVDCACVIHGDAYSWTYVDHLYGMLKRNLSHPVRMHVFTEAERAVPAHMVKHVLEPWAKISGPKRAWWYKMQLFDPRQFAGRLLYFDLDVVITGNIDWMLDLTPKYFWTIRDFRYLWRSNWQGINSSIMYWDTRMFPKIWKLFRQENLSQLMRRHAGDQDYLTSILNPGERRFLDDGLAQSWRWQIREGGMNMKTRQYRQPGAGSIVPETCKFVIFHGRPKPHEIHDDFMTNHWH